MAKILFAKLVNYDYLYNKSNQKTKNYDYQNCWRL